MADDDHGKPWRGVIRAHAPKTLATMFTFADSLKIAVIQRALAAAWAAM